MLTAQKQGSKKAAKLEKREDKERKEGKKRLKKRGKRERKRTEGGGGRERGNSKGRTNGQVCRRELKNMNTRILRTIWSQHDWSAIVNCFEM